MSYTLIDIYEKKLLLAEVYWVYWGKSITVKKQWIVNQNQGENFKSQKPKWW